MKKIITEKLESIIGTSFNTKGLQQRGVADLIEQKATDLILELKSEHIITEKATSRRSIEDVQIKQNNQLYKIDIKSHESTSDFSMPNLISIDRLKKLYINENNHLIYVFISYSTTNSSTTIETVKVCYVENLDWSILAIQNLGKGQLQIKNMNNKLILNENVNREEWVETLRTNALDYYTKLITKIEKLRKEW
ncbi:hypothetical protein M0Q50_09925 [bacterium]|jgi:hypothetical protein|nr:hypothetical protein [bacterium]